MRVTVVCGVSGAGKTWTRTQPGSALAALPFIDIADIYAELEADDSGLVVADYWTAMDILTGRIVAARLKRTPHLVVEGYFLPNTDSRRWLENLFHVQGIGYEFVTCWAPLDVCSDRLLAQWEALTDEERDAPGTFARFKKRSELLVKCWRPQELADAKEIVSG